MIQLLKFSLQRHLLLFALVGSLIGLGPGAILAKPDRYQQSRRKLVEDHLVNPTHGTPITDTRVLEAMRRVPRHRFVPAAYRDRAYENSPLPIGYGQTISQPYIVALMTQLLQLTPGETVLEIGTGSGYHAAVLSEIPTSVFSVEIVPELASSANKRLSKLGYDRVTVKQGDGYYGWPENAPFAAIVVTAAPSHIPPPLIEQLEPGGRMVIPVGSAYRVQQLMLVTKDDEGTVRKQGLMPVRFVPFTRSAPKD